MSIPPCNKCGRNFGDVQKIELAGYVNWLCRSCAAELKRRVSQTIEQYLTSQKQG